MTPVWMIEGSAKLDPVSERNAPSDGSRRWRRRSASTRQRCDAVSTRCARRTRRCIADCVRSAARSKHLAAARQARTSVAWRPDACSSAVAVGGEDELLGQRGSRRPATGRREPRRSRRRSARPRAARRPS